MKPILKHFIVVLLIAACSKSSKITDVVLYKVVGIKDGDTIEILYKGKKETVRLLDIDCPEKKQPYGTKAKQFTSDMCFNKEVSLREGAKRDRYKRILATVYVEDIILNEELVKAGLAWHYKKYSKDNHYAELEDEARANKIGLWSDASPVAPWEFRRK